MLLYEYHVTITEKRENGKKYLCHEKTYHCSLNSVYRKVANLVDCMTGEPRWSYNLQRNHWRSVNYSFIQMGNDLF